MNQDDLFRLIGETSVSHYQVRLEQLRKIAELEMEIKAMSAKIAMLEDQLDGLKPKAVSKK